MRPKIFNSLKVKFSILVFILISMIMTANTWRDIHLTEQKLLNSQKEKTALLSDRISHGIMILMLKNQWKDLQSMMEGLVKDSKEMKELRIFVPETGIIVASSDPADVGKKIYQEDSERFRKGEENAFLIRKNDKIYSSKLTPIENLPPCHRCHPSERKILGVMDIEISLDTVYETIRKFKKEHFRDAIIGFILIIFVFLFIVSILIDRPINKMITTIRRIEKGDLSARMNVKQKDELGLLAKSFNNMVESLEKTKRELEEYHTEQIEKAAKLASLGEVASGIAHEIKNPLTGISCAIQVLQSELSEDDNKRTLIDEVLNQIKRLDRTVKDLLVFAKPKPPYLVSSKIYDVIEKAMFLVNAEAKKQNIIIETDIEKEIPTIRMDPDQIQQVLLNLMINAVQAMPEGGKLSISVSVKDYKEVRSNITMAPRTDKVLAAKIQDTGEGISPEDMEDIFKPFFTKKSKGTGLGLSISRKIIRGHGGEIICESNKGKGTVFTIYLPIPIENHSTVL
jgi:two-component system, NtrC family, sensor kinase